MMRWPDKRQCRYIMAGAIATSQPAGRQAGAAMSWVHLAAQRKECGGYGAQLTCRSRLGLRKASVNYKEIFRPAPSHLIAAPASKSGPDAAATHGAALNTRQHKLMAALTCCGC